MKILHTSDWHLGQELYSYDRREEQEAFLCQLRDIVAAEQPDVMVVCGDVYHNATPSNSVMRLFTDRVDRLRSAAPAMQIVVTAGNHDSASRLEITRTLWEHLKVTVIGRVEKREGSIDFARHIVPIRNAKGEKIGYVVALPHIFPQNYPTLNETTPGDNRQARFMQALAEEAARINSEGLPVVMTAHMAIAGSDITGHDDSRGGMDYTDLETLCIRYDYLALGHIHCPQNVKGTHARYCGSPLPISFDEHYPHSVTVVEVAAACAEPVIHTIPITNVWPLRTLPHEAVEFEEAMKLLEQFPADERAYLRLNVRLKEIPPANALERATLALKGKEARFCCFKWTREATTMPSTALPAWDTEQLKSISPVEVAGRFYRDTYGEEMDEALTGMLTTVVEGLSCQASES